MTIPFVCAARMLPRVPVQSIVIDFVIVTVPKPPGSRQLISPAPAVFEIAPANVLHGAVRLHGLASSPTPETQVRLAWPKAELGKASATSTIAGASLAILRGEIVMPEQYAFLKRSAIPGKI